MKKLLILSLAVTILALNSCSKKEGTVAPTGAKDTTAKPGSGATKTATGSLSGIITPAAAVDSVTILSLKDPVKTYKVGVDTVTGKFSLANLDEGSYTVSFLNTTAYTPVPPVTAVVAAGKNTDLGAFTPAKIDYRLSCEVNGVLMGWLFKANYFSGQLYIEPESVATYPEDQQIREYVFIDIKNITAPGSYVCNQQPGCKITHTRIHSGSGFPVEPPQTSANPGGGGKVIITAIDSVKRTISGTFTATLTSPSGNAADTKAITKGIINESY